MDLDLTEEQRQEIRAQAEKIAASFGRSDIEYVESLLLRILSNQKRRINIRLPEVS